MGKQILPQAYLNAQLWDYSAHGPGEDKHCRENEIRGVIKDYSRTVWRDSIFTWLDKMTIYGAFQQKPFYDSTIC